MGNDSICFVNLSQTETKADKDTATAKDELPKNALKMNKETKVDQALAPVRDAPKKSKTKTDKGNKMDFQRILAVLNTLVLSKEEAGKVVAVLREKNPSALDSWHMELKEEKVKVAQLEKLLNDQQMAAKRDLNLSLAKTQCTCKEIESMKMMIQQLTEETNQTISQLRLENKIWWDAVKTTLEKIRQKCSCH
ncbi:hypothetical protein ANANG_G00081910 [Anguilla anguilla]|uniref:Uncharacterized protein n=1 Tax=Anguilla anguilla TaxID=7936 RepID=A0A9D3S506_ANGAN|nr:hypothetical protein ANANG_G00081910 [Anguilla anguilla]